MELVGDRKVEIDELNWYHLVCTSRFNNEIFQHYAQVKIFRLQRENPRDHFKTCETWLSQDNDYPEFLKDHVDELLDMDSKRFSNLNKKLNPNKEE